MQTTARKLFEAAPLLSVGILTADLLRLGDELVALDDAGIALVHVDVMDGVFCPQMTVGPPIVKAIPDRFVKDVHLMVDEPLDKVAAYVEAGAGIVTFHVEATRHPHRVLRSLADTGVVRGVALNPGTPLALAEPLLDDLDLLLLLAVDPGWSGQKLIPATLRKLEGAKALVADREIVLAVDGGITKANVARVAAYGVDLIVTGSAVFDGVSPKENARDMLGAARAATGKGPAVLAGVDPKEGG
jgi:ribulose-phosphate 3-epimerase